MISSPRSSSCLLAMVLSCALVFITPPFAVAQTPPDKEEVARYSGLCAIAHNRDAAGIEKLRRADAKINARDAHGRTALHVATFARQGATIRALAKAGAKLGVLDDERYDVVTIAAIADDEEILRVLLSLGASATLITSIYDGTALIATTHLGHDGVVRQLIAADAPPDHVNNLHWTALIEASVLGDGGPCQVATVRALVEAGANTQLGDRAASRRCNLRSRAAMLTS